MTHFDYFGHLFLLNSNNIDVQNTEGNTALHIATMCDKPECLKLLLRGGANSNIGKFVLVGFNLLTVFNSRIKIPYILASFPVFQYEHIS